MATRLDAYILTCIIQHGAYAFNWMDATKTELSVVRRLIADGTVRMKRTDSPDTVQLIPQVTS